MLTTTPSSPEEKLLSLIQTAENLIKEAEGQEKKVNEFFMDFAKTVGSASPESSLIKKEVKKIEDSENTSLIFWVGLIASLVFPLLFIVNPGLSAIGSLLIGVLLIKTYISKKKLQESIQEL